MVTIDPNTKEYLGTGRRKTAVARVRIKPGEGKVNVNGREFDKYFFLEDQRMIAMQPFAATENENKFDVRVNVSGGGLSGQAEAMRHGIARALLVVDPEHRPVLKAAGLLTRDARQRERKKYGQPGARKRFQYSKR
jgi:small subunit ribosomal protein S9